MKNPQASVVLLCCGALGLLAGCASGPDSRVVSAPPPPAPTTSPGMAPAGQPVVVVQPQTQQPGGNYVVVQAPPAPQPEAVPARPSTQHVWIAGYWTWQNNRYAWMAGHWEVPPTRTAVWVNPRWEPEGNSFRFYEGYWRN